MRLMLECCSLHESFLSSLSSSQPYHSQIYPSAPSASILYSPKDDKIIGSGITTYTKSSVLHALESLPLTVTPLADWVVSYKESSARDLLEGLTLYTTLEPSSEKVGTDPAITDLILKCGIKRVVIGSPSPIEERSMRGASALHSAGVDVSICVGVDHTDEIIAGYVQRSSNSLARKARKFQRRTSRPLGLLHCSVIKSEDHLAFERNGNAFGRRSGGKILSARNFGTFELAPPPRRVWAEDDVDPDWFDPSPIEVEEDRELEKEVREKGVSCATCLLLYCKA